MKNKAPINNLDEITIRKEQLKANIKLQEHKLSKDLDAYHDDLDTLKKIWNGLKSVKRFGDNFSISEISNMARILPIGNKKNDSDKSTIITAFTLGAELVSWIIKRRKEKKKKINEQTIK